VVHDTDNQGGDLDALLVYLRGFKHGRTYTDLRPWTTVVRDS